MDDTDVNNEDELLSSEQSGGGEMGKSFVDYITTFSSLERSQLLNLLQYCSISILPLLTVLKLMKLYMPINNTLKPSSELIFEVILQLVVIIFAFFLIHKFVVYFPTYSKTDYDKFSLLSGVLPLLFLMFTLDTKISDKLNVLFDRLLASLGIIKEPFEEEERDSKKKKEEKTPMTDSAPLERDFPSFLDKNAMDTMMPSGNANNSGTEGFYQNFDPLPANQF